MAATPHERSLPTGTTRGAVPLTRRLLTVHPLRSATGAAGIGLALMLMLLLAGLWAGVQDRVTTFDDHLGADLVVVRPAPGACSPIQA